MYSQSKQTELSSVLQSRIREVMLRLPFYWVILSETRFVANPTISTLYITENIGVISVVINPRFFLSQQAEQQRALLLHEVNHLVLGHLHYPHPEHEQDKLAWAIACDCTANEFVPYELPKGAITLSMFQLPEKESTWTRFLTLRKINDLASCCPKSFDNIGSHIQQPSSEDCMYPSDLIMKAAIQGQKRFDQHMHKLCLSKSEDREGMEYWHESEQREFSPHSIAPMMEAILSPKTPPVISWTQVLKKKIMGHNTARKSKKRAPRRLPHLLGFIPGNTKSRKKARVLVAIDTSGSMSSKDFDEIATELKKLAKTKSEILCVQCDTDIVHEERITTAHQISQVYGRGGTDLRPPFERAKKQRFDYLVYFTDGYGPAPKNPPKKLDVLWVLTGDNHETPADYGLVLQLHPQAY